MDNLLQSIHAVLSSTPARWLSLTEALPVELLTRPSAPGEWSALNCLQHLLDAERLVFPVRVQGLLAGQDFAAFDPDAQGTVQAGSQSPTAVAAQFAETRAANLALLNQVTLSDFSRTARHAELGLVTLAELLHEWAGHDLMHTVQAEQALMQLFIAGCGPWRPYFIAHEIAQKK
ncbi:MAG: hypothetical protein BroJett011_65670 [Chloroflexota bacterium]|nr:MAG: hypothetical protein BroJett011_65670 [Chloroflexota bacterium]